MFARNDQYLKTLLAILCDLKMRGSGKVASAIMTLIECWFRFRDLGLVAENYFASPFHGERQAAIYRMLDSLGFLSDCNGAGALISL